MYNVQVLLEYNVHTLANHDEEQNVFHKFRDVCYQFWELFIILALTVKACSIFSDLDLIHFVMQVLGAILVICHLTEQHYTYITELTFIHPA